MCVGVCGVSVVGDGYLIIKIMIHVQNYTSSTSWLCLRDFLAFITLTMAA